MRLLPILLLVDWRPDICHRMNGQEGVRNALLILDSNLGQGELEDVSLLVASGLSAVGVHNRTGRGGL